MDKTELIEIINAVMDAREAKEAQFNPMGKLESDQLDKLAKAFSAMQGEYGSVIPNRVNPMFKSNYADLDAAVKSVRPLLKKYGFSLDQDIEYQIDGSRYLRTKLLHESGQYISSFDKIIEIELPPIEKPRQQDYQSQQNYIKLVQLRHTKMLQSYGSSLSYHKRYNTCTLLGITISNDPDDNDAEYGKQINIEQEEQKQVKEGDTPKKTILLSETEIDFINENLEGYDNIRNDIFRTLKIERLEDCPKSLFDTIVMFIDAKKGKSSN